MNHESNADTAATNDFGRALRAVRLSRNLSQREMAQRLGINPTYVHRLESGHRAPLTNDKILAMAPALELSANELETLQNAAEYREEKLVGGRVVLQLPVASPQRLEVLRLMNRRFSRLRDEQLDLLEAVLNAEPERAPESYLRIARQALSFLDNALHGRVPAEGAM